MSSYRFSIRLIGALAMVLTSSVVARGATIEYYDEDEFKAAYSGALAMESFYRFSLRPWGEIVMGAHYSSRTMMASISTAASLGNVATPTAARAG